MAHGKEYSETKRTTIRILKMAARYYVYTLTDPRTQKVFYVGKGQGDRINQHERDARSGVDHPKCEVINSIEKDGLSVQKYVVKRFKNEDAAYRYEANLIKKIGLEKLTNLAPGGRNPYSYKKRPEDKDALWIDVVSFLAKKTGGTFAAVFDWCGTRMDLGEKLGVSVKNRIRKLVEDRGADWVVKEFKKHNINLDLVSKVENHGSPA